MRATDRLSVAPCIQVSVKVEPKPHPEVVPVRRGKFKTRAVENPLLVLLDNKMPNVTGLEVLKIMKADENLKLIPVVALTSSRETPDLKEFYKYGVNAYVVKPVDYSEFIEAFKQIGIFWAAVNEPPPNVEREETST
jgi:CheY-like chemotaxis protein